MFIVASSVGASVHDMYMILLQATIVLTLIPYLYMFAALVHLCRRATRDRWDEGFFKSRWVCYGAGWLGFVVTALCILFACIPADSVEDPLGFEVKLLGGVLTFLLPALVCYFVNARRRLAALTHPLEPQHE
jgi:amino acid transporter